MRLLLFCLLVGVGIFLVGIGTLLALVGVGMAQHALHLRRLRRAARGFACPECGATLGDQALDLAEALARRRWDELRERHPDVRFRLERLADAVCPRCGAWFRSTRSGGRSREGRRRRHPDAPRLVGVRNRTLDARVRATWSPTRWSSLRRASSCASPRCRCRGADGSCSGPQRLASPWLTVDYCIGRRLLSGEYPPNLAAVVDLTCEFSEQLPLLSAPEFRVFPILDAGAVSAAELTAMVREIAALPRPVYLHCARGHGRTAMVASALLLHLGLAESAADAERRVLDVRPGARMNRRQRAAVERLATSSALRSARRA